VDWLVETDVLEKRAVSIFRAELPTKPHGDLTQKNIIGIVTAVKISNLT
jgi:hypothetical protein